jgi:hypothetical protein
MAKDTVPASTMGYVHSVIYCTRYGYSSWQTDSCTVLDPLGAQALRRPRQLSGPGGEVVLGESTSYIFRFYLFLTLLHNFNSLLYAGTFLFGGRRYLKGG